VASNLLMAAASATRAAGQVELPDVDIRGVKALITEAGRLLETAYRDISAAGYKANHGR
jgi:hypothetical protein